MIPRRRKTRKRKTPIQKAKEQATRLHSLIVRARGRCENCGTDAALQCAHIVSRRYANTRTDLSNAFCLCAACHLHFTLWPLEFASYTIDRIGEEAYDGLKAKAQSGLKMDWPAEVDRLTREAQRRGITF